jgi:hypothetical protein
MDKDKKDKLEFIRAFHDEAENRIDFLILLDKQKHRYEALTLCVCYIDSFSQWLCWPSPGSGRNFVQTIIKFGGNPLMGLVHPLQAIRAFESKKSFWNSIAKKIEDVFPGPTYELNTEDAFLTKLNTKLETEESHKLKPECWRGTLAATAYYFLRNPSVHGFGASELSFSRALYKGRIISGMGFKELHDIVKNIHIELRRRSENNIQWFGNDKIVGIGV